MNNKSKGFADANGKASKEKLNQNADGDFRSFFVPNNNTGLSEIENKVKEITRSGKIKRCFKCISCNKPRTPRKMSAIINVCRDCLNGARSKGRIAQSNFINRLANDFLKSLKREVQNAQF